jgi:pimeloyl-ACP methyl ester carboxylesterase
MGTYGNLMIPYIVGSGILDESHTGAVLEYLQTHGGLCMGMLRIHQHSGLFANEDGLDDGYTSRYVQALLRRDDVDRVLVSFYGKLAQGFTRDTFVGAEGTSMVALDGGGRPMYLPPNSTGNAFFLAMLRDLLVQDESTDDNGVPDKLRLLFATPRAWLDDGKTIKVKNAPTVFGPVSVIAHSDLAHSNITVEVSPPPRPTHSTQIRLRPPLPWKVLSASIGDEKLPIGPDGTFDITSQKKPFTLQVAVSREISAAPLHRYADHSKLMMYMDDQGAEHPVQTPQDWQQRRQDILLGMQAVMGDLPGCRDLPSLDVKVTEQFQGDGFVRQKLSFVAEGQDRIPAYLFVPQTTTGAKYPAVLALHQTTSVGKMEPAGLAGNMPYGLELARRGYVVLCPDEPSFGEYQYDFHAPGNGYVSGSIKAIANHMRCIDLLTQRPEVDVNRIGVIGHSLGGHNSLFLAAFDPRVKAVVTNCGWTPFADYQGGNITGWTSDRYMPRLRDVYHLNVAEVPFDFYEVIAAIAPRPLLSISPTQDANFDVNGVKKAIAAAGQIYKLLGAPDALQAIYPNCAHSFPPENREKAYAFLDAQLGNTGK